MARKVSPGQVDTFVIQNANVSGIDFSGVLEGYANNSFGVADFSKVLINAVLHRGGSQMSVIQGNLLSLMKAQYFFDDRYDFDGTTTTSLASSHDVIVNRGSSVKGKALVPLQLNLSGILNLKGRDRLEVEMQWTQQAATSGVSADSYLTIDYIDGVGLEYFTPTIKTYAVQDGQNEWTRSLGNNVQSCHFLNLDKTTTTLADQVIEVAQFKSDKLKYSKNWYQLLAERSGQSEQNLDRDQSFSLYHGTHELDGAELELRLNDGNVNAAKNYIVVRQFRLSRSVVRKARIKARKHASKNASKFG